MTVGSLRVLRIYHGGRNPTHRDRERALLTEGIAVTLVVPSSWPEAGARAPAHEPFDVVELPVAREGDVNRHRFSAPLRLRTLIGRSGADVLDIHEEPFSVAAHQWLAAAPPDLPVVMYTAQNIDKRFPPPYAQYEKAAYRRTNALYPCSTQAASVARGKGFRGPIEVLPLGYDDATFEPGAQSLDDDEFVLLLAGRLEPYKGVTDAVRILAHVHASRPARLVVVGTGPEEATATELAKSLGVSDRLEIVPWQSNVSLAATYRTAHLLLIPSRPTETWVEQFGRVIVEAQASGAVVAGYASGAIPEVVGEAAVLTAVGATMELTSRIVALAANPTEYDRLRRKGLDLSRTRTWSQVAARQADLYRRVVAGELPQIDLPRSPQARRAVAREEFGPTAPTSAGTRPFALPVLRRGGSIPRTLAAALDRGAELWARARAT